MPPIEIVALSIIGLNFLMGIVAALTLARHRH